MPDDWVEVELGEVADIVTGNTPPTQDPGNYGGEIPFVSPADIGEDKFVTKTQKNLSKRGFSLSRPMPPGSVLFVCIGSTIGKVAMARFVLTANQQINAVLPSARIDCEFLYYLLASEISTKIKILAGHQAVPIVNKRQFSTTRLTVAPLAEQRVIATALSDMDALIAAQEKLIAKKRNIKTATMQQLLTGRKRLTGFGQGRRFVQSELGSLPEDWRCSRVEQCADVASGTTPSRAKQERYFHNGEHDWVKTLDLTNSEIEIVQEQITCYALKETSLRLFPAGTVLVAMYGGFNQIGRTGLLKRPAAVNQAISAIIPWGLVVPRFLLEQINYRVEHWRTIASSSRKDPNITGQDVRTFKLPLPPLPEQKAIAEVLSDMDAEITALGARLAKLRDIKHGMMQELLTGRTRLV